MKTKLLKKVMIHDYYYEDFKHKNEVNQKVWWRGK